MQSGTAFTASGSVVHEKRLLAKFYFYEKDTQKQ
jgi:hypothetical protein